MRSPTNRAERFTEAPSLAIPKAIKNAGLQPANVQLYEINEAFAVVALANLKLLGLSDVNVNVNGKVEGIDARRRSSFGPSVGM